MILHSILAQLEMAHKENDILANSKINDAVFGAETMFLLMVRHDIFRNYEQEKSNTIRVVEMIFP
jgi:hypothetical protein